MQQNPACSIVHHLLRSKGLNLKNPATPLVEWSVLSDHLLGTLQQAFDARLRVLMALREQGQAVEELDRYWRLADETRTLAERVKTARDSAAPLPTLWPIGPVAEELRALDSIVQRQLRFFQILHALVVILAIDAALRDPSGRTARTLIQQVLRLQPDQAHLIALWQKVIREGSSDIGRLVGSTRSYVGQGVEWQASKLEKTDRGLPHGLTAHGHSAEERDRVASNVDYDINVLDNVLDDGDGGEFNSIESIESLDPDRRHDLRNALLPKLSRRANLSQKELLKAVLLQGEDPSKVWKSRSDWNGLMNKAARIGKAHSGNR